NNRRQLTAKTSFDQWIQRNPVAAAPAPVNPMQARFGQAPPPPVDPSDRIVRAVIFHEALEAGGSRSRTTRNAGFRDLDQSWRMAADDPGAVAVIYGRVLMQSGPAR